MKTCVDCNLSKSESDFYSYARGALMAHCKACNNKRTHIWQSEHKERKAQACRKWRQRNAARYKVMNTAKNALWRAIRAGHIVRGTTCKKCRRTDKRIEAAHFDYAQPLVVTWLCVSCHRHWDMSSPKS